MLRNKMMSVSRKNLDYSPKNVMDSFTMEL